MPQIHLIRHGETDGNRNHYVGRRDLALNTIGQAQAEALADRLAGRPIGRIISSPLLRAVQTANPLADRLGLAVEHDAALIEFDFGLLQDLPKADKSLNLRRNHALVPVDGGESLKDVWTRLFPLAASLESEGRDAEMVLVGHYWSCRMLHGMLSGLSFEQTLMIRTYKPENGTSTCILPNQIHP